MNYDKLKVHKLYQITNEINIHDELLSEELLENVISLINSKGFRFGWKSNKNVEFGHRNLGFSDTGRPRLNKEDVTDELPDEVRPLWHKVQSTLLKNHPILLRAYCNAYTFGTEGYIHRDSKFEEVITVIIYLNERWKADWPAKQSYWSREKLSNPYYPSGTAFLFSLPK